MHCFNCLNFSWSVRTFCNLILYLKSTRVFCISFFGGQQLAQWRQGFHAAMSAAGAARRLWACFWVMFGIEFGQVIEEKDVFKLMRGLPTQIIESILILVGINIFWGFDLPPDGGDWSYHCSERVRVQVAELLVPFASYESKRSGAKPLGIILRVSTSSVKLLDPNPCVAQSLKRLEIPARRKCFVAQAQWASILQWIHWEELVCRVISVCLLCWDIVPSMYNCIKHNFNIFGTSSYHIISPHIIIRSEKKHTLHLDKHQQFSGS